MSTPTDIGSLIDTAHRLSDLVAEENAILKARRPRELAAHQEEKGRLTGTYERQLAALKSNPKLLQEAGPAALSRLKAAMRRFQMQLEEHRRIVQAAKSVTERMLKAISNSAVERRGAVRGYDEGAVIRPVVGAQRNSVPLTLDTMA